MNKTRALGNTFLGLKWRVAGYIIYSVRDTEQSQNNNHNSQEAFYTVCS